MDLLKHLIPMLVSLSLALLVVAIGLKSARGEFLSVLRRPMLLLRAVIAIDVVPLLGAVTILTLFTALPMAAKAAIILMAISPVPPLVPGKALKFGGRQEYVYGLQLAMALLAIVSVPLLGAATAALYQSEAHFPVSIVAGNVFAGLIVPLAFGLVLGRWLWPAAAPRLAPWVSRAGNVLLVVAFLPLIAGSWHQMLELIGDGTVIAMAATVGVAMIGAHFLGEKDLDERSTLVFAAAMRHPGIALALAGANHADKTVSAGVLLFLLVGIVVLVPYQIAVKRTARRAQEDGTIVPV